MDEMLPTTTTIPPLSSGQDGVPIGEAADRLGISVEAARKRVQRGTLPAEKGPDGLWYVYLPDGQDATLDGSRTDSDKSQDFVPDAVVDTLRDEVHWLRAELQRRSDELRQEREFRVEAERRRDVLFAQFGEQLKQISSTTTTVQEQVEAVAHEVVAEASPSEPAVDEAPVARPSWWRRFFLGEQ